MHELETFKLQIYIIFYYIYVLILVEKQKEQPKGRMEEKGVEAIEAGKGMGQGNDGERRTVSLPLPPLLLHLRLLLLRRVLLRRAVCRRPPVCRASIGNGWWTRWQRRHPLKRRSGKESAWWNGRLMVARRCRKPQLAIVVS